MRFFECEQQSTSLRTCPPQQRYQVLLTFVLKLYCSLTAWQTGVRDAAGSGTPSASVSRLPSLSTGSPARSMRRPRSSTRWPSFARSGRPRKSTRGSPVGCGQESVV